MKLSCKIVEDLFPLYLDEVCSRESREAVEKHLKECRRCRGLSSENNFPHIPEIPPKEEEKALKKSMKKIKVRWWLSIVCIFMIFPLVCGVIFTRNELRGEGIGFSNIDEIWKGHRFLTALKNGNGEKAASYINFLPYYEECRHALQMTAEDHMPLLKDVVIGGEAWMVREEFWDQYKSLADPWTEMLRQMDPQVMIPVEVFYSIVDNDDGLNIENMGYRMSNGVCYFGYTAGDRKYMIHEEAYDLLSEELLLPDCVSMIPASVYLEQEPILRQRAELWCDRTYERLEPIAGLNEEDFCVYMRQWYGAKIEQFYSGGDDIVRFQYNSAYFGSNSWQVEFDGMIEYGGKVNRVRFVLNIEKNGIVDCYISGNENVPDYFGIRF